MKNGVKLQFHYIEVRIFFHSLKTLSVISQERKAMEAATVKNVVFKGKT